MSKTYLIPKQLKVISDRDVKILKLMGIDLGLYQKNSVQKNILLCKVDFTIRVVNVLTRVLEYEGLDWKTLTIAEFVGRFSEKDLLRYRNMGNKSIKEMNHSFYPYGFELRKGY
jgi:hypothetical protein